MGDAMMATRESKSKNVEWYGPIKKRYNLNANDYDHEHSRRDTPFGYIEKRRRDCIFSLLARKGRILDTACGTGYYMEKLSENECFGLDISEKSIKCCKEKKLNNICVGTYENLPYKDCSFDIILCINAFQHTQNPKMTLTEINRVLKEDGEVILTFPNWTSFRSGIIHLLRKFYIKGSHERRYTIFTLKRMFDILDLKITEVYGFNFLPYKSHHRRVNLTILKLCELFERKIEKSPLKYFGNELVVKLTKMK